VSELFDFTLPHLIQGKTKGALSISDKRLLGFPRHFVRFDLYPLVSPPHRQRPEYSFETGLHPGYRPLQSQMHHVPPARNRRNNRYGYS